MDSIETVNWLIINFEGKSMITGFLCRTVNDQSLVGEFPIELIFHAPSK